MRERYYYKIKYGFYRVFGGCNYEEGFGRYFIFFIIVFLFFRSNFMWNKNMFLYYIRVIFILI